MTNVLLGVIALALLFHPRVGRSFPAFFLLFRVAVHNVVQVWSYIPLRSVRCPEKQMYR
jgi:hypothetical protein